MVVERSSLFTMVTSAIEVYNRETMGFLFGKLKYRTLRKKHIRAMVLDAAFPLQSTRRKPSQIEVSNLKAFGRVEATIDSMGYEIIGEYHSHPNWIAKLSKSDKMYAKERRDELVSQGFRKERMEWLEVVMAIDKREYENPHEIGWSFHDYSKKAGAVFTIDEWTGFTLTIAAYWLRDKNGHIQAREAQVFIPWTKGYWTR